MEDCVQKMGKGGSIDCMVEASAQVQNSMRTERERVVEACHALPEGLTWHLVNRVSRHRFQLAMFLVYACISDEHAD